MILEVTESCIKTLRVSENPKGLFFTEQIPTTVYRNDVADTWL